MVATKMAAPSVMQRNIPYIRQQLGAALQSCSASVKFITGTLFLCYLLSYSDTVLRAVCITPGYIIPPNFWVWTAFTHAFFEDRFFMVLADVVTVGLCGKLLEPLWGAMEMMTFFAIVNICSSFIAVTYFILLYSITWDTHLLFDVKIHGLAAYCAGVIVAVKQMMPDHVLIALPIGKLRNRNMPLTVWLFSIILWACRILRGTYPVMFCSGLITSWIYLRFYQHHSNGTKGDMADHFCFASFFPNVLQPPIAVFCNTLFEFMVRLKLCRKPMRKYNMAGATSSSSVTINLPGTDAHDAERRRQIALRALNERLTKIEGSASWDKSKKRGAQVNIAMSATPDVMTSSAPLPVKVGDTSSGAGDTLAPSVAISRTMSADKLISISANSPAATSVVTLD